jgi:hypothetical protein
MCFFLGCGLEVFFIFWVSKFLADFNQKFSKIYSNLHLEKEKKSPNFWVNIWQNFTIKKKKNHLCGSKKLHLSSFQYKTMIMVGAQKIYLKVPSFLGSMSFMFK